MLVCVNSLLNISTPAFLFRGIFFVTKGTFGQLTCEWQYLFNEFTKDPLIVEDRRLRIEAKVRSVKGLSFVPSQRDTEAAVVL